MSDSGRDTRGTPRFELVLWEALNDIGEHALATAKTKGFITDEKGPEIDQKLLLVVSEICEAQDVLRSGYSTSQIYMGPDGKPEGFPIEIADAVIRIAQLCASQGIDLGAAVKMKMVYNNSRPHKHGREF